jgi:hypothetical protein
MPQFAFIFGQDLIDIAESDRMTPVGAPLEDLQPLLYGRGRTNQL